MTVETSNAPELRSVLSTSPRRCKSAIPALAAGPAVCLAVCMILVPLAGVARSADREVWDFAPYRTRAFVALLPEGAWPVEEARRVCAALTQRWNHCAGPRVPMEAEPAASPLATRCAEQGVEGLGPADVADFAEEADKVFVVCVRRTKDILEMSAREFDRLTQSLGTTHARRLSPEAAAAEAVASLLAECFRPLGRVESVENGKATLRLRGAGLPIAESGLFQPRPGDVFTLAAAPRRAANHAIPAVEIPFTFCILDRTDPAAAARNELSCRVEMALDGLAPPPTGVAWIALAARPVAQPTRLTCQSREEPPRALPGLEIALGAPGGEATRRIGTTDALGQIMLPAPVGAAQVEHLVVRASERQVARFPIVAGLESSVLVSLPIDAPWLEAAAAAQAIAEELKELAARRELYRRRAEQCTRAGLAEEAARWLARERELPSHEQFLTRVTEAKRRAAAPESNRADIEALFEALETPPAARPRGAAKPSSSARVKGG